MSTANVSEEFPLHSAVWENDYRRLETQMTLPQVGENTQYPAKLQANLC